MVDPISFVQQSIDVGDSLQKEGKSKRSCTPKSAGFLVKKRKHSSTTYLNIHLYWYLAELYILEQTTYLFPVFLILNGIHGAAWFSIQHEVKSSIFAETTGVAQERVFFVIVDGSKIKPTSI